MILHILIPSGDMVHADFMMAFYCLTSHISQHPPVDGMYLKVSNQRSSLIHLNRQQMVENSIKSGATHILFLDSDMTFPADAFNRLYAHNKPVVAASYVQRAAPTLSNTIRKDHKARLITSEDSTGLEEASSTGLGLCLFDAKVFEETPRPWFDTYWMEEEKGFTMIGEDVFLFRKLAHSGYPLYIDHDLSKEVGHIGQFTYTHRHAEINIEEGYAYVEGEDESS
jgi:hypothetical protein